MMKSHAWRVLFVASAVLILLTTYLAIFYAPLPQTSVKSAEKVLPDIGSIKIRVAGFVSSVFLSGPPQMVEASKLTEFSIADFSDYQRYLDAAANDRLGEQWWTVRPIDVAVRSGGTLSGGVDVGASIKDGTNLSVLAVVVAKAIGPNSNVTGYSLSVDNGNDVTIGTSAGQFGIMTAPVAQKIFYFHMPSAWVSYLAFFVTLVASALYLKTRDMKYDRWASCSAELGVLFATIAIITGPVWAKQEWGVYWRWDDTKLVTTFILWLVYIGYQMLRASMTDTGTRARVGAVYGILGFVTVPMSLLSSRVAPLLQSSHPQVIASKSGSLSPEAGMTIGIAIIAFALLFITMLIRRVEIAESEEELEELKRIVGGEN
jgi:heme exporter protein C